VKAFIETGGKWSSARLFIRKIFSPSPNFPHPKGDLRFLHRSLAIDISEGIRDY
jgi:hypothetical protein